MTRIQKTALLAFLLLLVVAAIGTYLGGGKARPADAQPATIVLETEELASIRLLPPERRQVLQPNRFGAPPVKNPLQDIDGRNPGGVVAEMDTNHGFVDQPAIDDGQLNLEEAGYRSIRVRQGEILTRISKRELGDASRWKEILRLNGIEKDRDLRVGQELFLPHRDTPFTEEHLGAPDSIDLPSDGQVYVVQRGDVLGRIAKQFYGSAQETERILLANGLQNANQIYAGQQLVIPARAGQ